ncbi:hypothetical protein [Kribbella sp. NPDC051770]|uniref:hypothetical protein n=1 Tax=Kribbella sp. NPDC051770 TaxID=3155413 RepID=UPI00343DF6ED
MRSRRFRLMRHEDVSGVSGTGAVAEGVQFTDGAVALRWYGDYPTTTVWDGIESVIAIHGHGGATEVEWLDPDPGPDPEVLRREDLPPQPWPELHPAPEAEDDGPGPSLNPPGGDSRAAEPGGDGRGGSRGAQPGGADARRGEPGSGGSEGPGRRATRPIFPAEHGSAGPVFPAEHSGFAPGKDLFSEFMDNGLSATGQRGLTR